MTPELKKATGRIIQEYGKKVPDEKLVVTLRTAGHQGDVTELVSRLKQGLNLQVAISTDSAHPGALVLAGSAYDVRRMEHLLGWTEMRHREELENLTLSAGFYRHYTEIFEMGIAALTPGRDKPEWADWHTRQLEDHAVKYDDSHFVEMASDYVVDQYPDLSKREVMTAIHLILKEVTDSLQVAGRYDYSHQAMMALSEFLCSYERNILNSTTLHDTFYRQVFNKQFNTDLNNQVESFFDAKAAKLVKSLPLLQRLTTAPRAWQDPHYQGFDFNESLSGGHRFFSSSGLRRFHHASEGNNKALPYQFILACAEYKVKAENARQSAHLMDQLADTTDALIQTPADEIEVIHCIANAFRQEFPQTPSLKP